MDQQISKQLQRIDKALKQYKNGTIDWDAYQFQVKDAARIIVAIEEMNEDLKSCI